MNSDLNLAVKSFYNKKVMASVSSASSLNGSFRDPSFSLSLGSILSLHSLIDSYALGEDQWEAAHYSIFKEERKERNKKVTQRGSSRGSFYLVSVKPLLDTQKCELQHLPMREQKRTSKTIEKSGSEQLNSLNESSLKPLHLYRPREGTSRVLEGSPINSVSSSFQRSDINSNDVEQQEETICNGRAAGRIRVTKDQWRKEKRFSTPKMTSVAPRVNKKRHETIREQPQTSSYFSDTSSISSSALLNSALNTDMDRDDTADSQRDTLGAATSGFGAIVEESISTAREATEAAISAAAEATNQALRLVRLAELDRQRVLYRSQPVPKDEYNTIEEDIPPYRAQLHRYLDLVSYDERFTPILRVNRYLVSTDKELTTAITKFSKFNLLPETTNLWAISHVDDNEYENMIPSLIPESSYYLNDLMV